ncbi:Prostaglandin reductase 3 [Phytophthora pseudosyringae]|uniref:Prostaglandin reductase 3 n=1 Tax=Phytophthora pseudosyringae TaxID=221518 RepID=A0A8T1WFN8_9STRA|nr:Prostaglandin reductase 3 [Phytophthora pseudosyringae]
MPSYRRIQVHTYSTDFAKATEIVEEPELPTAGPGNVVVENRFLGINATDVNITNGGYGRTTLPVKCGLEAAGVVVEVGEGVNGIKVGDNVAYSSIGAFSEYLEVPATKIIQSPELSPALVPLTVCAVSASLALEKAGEMKSKETVFVSAAAGATGQFAVQLAKLAGNHVIGACSSDEKVAYLQSLGVDRPINYKKEDLDAVLKKEYPNGIDLAFEGVGGDLFKAVLDNIAVFGRIIVFGNCSHYHGDAGVDPQYGYQQNRKMQLRSASLRGFQRRHHPKDEPEHLQRLVKLVQEGKLKAGIDPTVFQGFESIPKALERLYAQKNVGKLIVRL